MKYLNLSKKAIILYVAVTVIEQLLNRPKNYSDLTKESFIIPKGPESATDSARRLLKSAEQHCK
ncbi:hypothetical protein KJB46_10910 [Staphylococcus hominis]|uniref:hypothetical protein n=1 Tax=Staphylococcus hominis TaxID=1290 RepID=UPI001F2DEA2B|nr:hypothetical protein [Staphylococcus hominis]MCE4990870.1 hypothetical protein [Staphylococcus hominis]